MTQRASFVGEYALRIMSHGSQGEVTRVFPRSVYLRSGDDFLLLLWGGLRSPMTINVPGEPNSRETFEVGQKFMLSKKKLESDRATITLVGSKIHRSLLRKKRRIYLGSASDLAKGVALLRSLYDVAAPGPLLPRDEPFAAFIAETLVPFAKGDERGIYEFKRYSGLIGRGGGFTPAGDDFVAGFVGTFNYIARCRGTEAVLVPADVVVSATVPESGAIVVYSSRGFVDEAMESLIIKSLGPAHSSSNDVLLSVASRGHTSGVDTALGVLMCEAASAERERGDGSLERCLAQL